MQIVYADMSEYGQLNEKIKDTCDAFFHLAWQGGRYDFASQYQNIEYALGALEAAARLGCKRFICTGSQAEYGPKKGLITEETCPHPADAYGGQAGSLPADASESCRFGHGLDMGADFQPLWKI